MEIVRVKYLVGQAVFAKIKGYPPWPSIITEIPRKGLLKVLYFNSNEYSVLSEKRIKPIQAGDDIVKKYKGNKAFTKALTEMNAVLKVETPKTSKKEPKKHKKKQRKTHRKSLRRRNLNWKLKCCPKKRLGKFKKASKLNIRRENFALGAATETIQQIERKNQEKWKKTRKTTKQNQKNF